VQEKQKMAQHFLVKQKDSGISHLLSLVRCLPLSDFYFIYVCFRISDPLPVCSQIAL